MSAISLDLSKWQPRGAPREYDPSEIIQWAIKRFARQSLAMTTSFGMEGVALLDMLARCVPDLRVIYIDTGFLFQETHQLRDRLAILYPQVNFEAVHPLLDAGEQQAEYGEALWSRDPDMCCKIRKVEPLHRAMEGVDVWFAALRRDQSSTRAEIKVVDWDWQYQVLKVCPLAAWTREQVYRYIAERRLPYNELHDRNYPTVGCTHCTKPVNGAKPWDYSREGRWVGFNKTECGLNGGAGI